MRKIAVPAFIFVCGLLAHPAWTYRTGAPTRACGDMTPQHGSPINTEPAPFLVEVSKTQYAPNERIYVRIRGCGIVKFKGFMIQPRSAIYPDRPAFLGAFLRVRGTRYECVRSGAVLTHSNPEEKSSVTLTWIAPPGPAGHVVFRVTFVQSYTNYWVGINSPVIYDGTSRDLSIMQAFSLQSATDQACLPTRSKTTTTTAATTTSTTTTTTPPVPTTVYYTPTEPYTTTEYYQPTTTTTTTTSTTTPRPTTTTTRRPTTTTTPRPTTTRRTTTTTTTTLPPPTTRRITTTERKAPTTAARNDPPTTEPYFYDYFFEQSTETKNATTQVQETSTQTIPQVRITTAHTPTTTMKFYEPSTTTTKPTTTSTKATTTTTTQTTTTTKATTTTTSPTTTEAPTTTPEIITMTIAPSVTTLYPTTTEKVWSTTSEQPKLTTKQITTKQEIITIPQIVELLPTTPKQLPVAVTSTVNALNATENLLAKTTYFYDYDMITNNADIQVPTDGQGVQTNQQVNQQYIQPLTNLTEYLPILPDTVPNVNKAIVLDENIPQANTPFQTVTQNIPLGEVPNKSLTQVTITQTHLTGSNIAHENTPHSHLPNGNIVQENIPHSHLPNGNTVQENIPHSNLPNGNTVHENIAHSHLPNGNIAHENMAHSQLPNGNIAHENLPHSHTTNEHINNPTEPPRREYIPSTRLPFYRATGQPVYPPTTAYPNYNPAVKTERYLTFPPQTYTSDSYPVSSTVRIDPTTAVAGVETTKPTPQAIPKTKLQPETNLYKDLDCGVKKGCFDDCINGLCSYVVSWSPEKDSTKFEIRTKPPTKGSYWAAIGFSDDKMMGLDSVTECILEGDKVGVYQSYNLDYYRNMRLLSPKLGIIDEIGSVVNGIFSCSFTRKNFVRGEKDVFDLNKDWHMMFAEGPAVNGVKIPHRYDRVPPVTMDRMDLQRYPPMHETYNYIAARKDTPKVIDASIDPIQVSVQQRSIAMDKSCGSTKSCFQDCTNDGCRFIVSWTGVGDHVMFNIRALLNNTSNQWIAIAFSEDDKMGDDSVVQCVARDDGSTDIRHSFNNGKNNMKLAKAETGLSNTSARFVDGIFECSFTRDRHVNNDKIYDLDRNWAMLFAHGKSKNGIMLPHTLAEKPHVSDNYVDFSRSAPSLISASNLFIKIHAALMVFGWILCASVASVIGRYFQPYWWGEKMFGSKAWVKVHWLFVLITCAIVIGGFAVIFVGVGGISKLYEHPTYSFNGTHPIMGLVVSLLALLNPLLLCLRPSEDSSSRAFFNCLYWLVEIGAHVLAVVTIYAGFGLASFLVPSFFTFLIIGFTVYQILILLFMEALKSYDAKKTIERKKLFLYEMQIRPWNARKNNSIAAYLDLNHTSKGLKQTVLAAHLILLSALTTTMIVLIIIHDKFTD